MIAPLSQQRWGAGAQQGGEEPLLVPVLKHKPLTLRNAATLRGGLAAAWAWEPAARCPQQRLAQSGDLGVVSDHFFQGIFPVSENTFRLPKLIPSQFREKTNAPSALSEHEELTHRGGRRPQLPLCCVRCSSTASQQEVPASILPPPHTTQTQSIALKRGLQVVPRCFEPALGKVGLCEGQQTVEEIPNFLSKSRSLVSSATGDLQSWAAGGDTQMMLEVVCCGKENTKPSRDCREKQGLILALQVTEGTKAGRNLHHWAKVSPGQMLQHWKCPSQPA